MAVPEERLVPMKKQTRWLVGYADSQEEITAMAERLAPAYSACHWRWSPLNVSRSRGTIPGKSEIQRAIEGLRQGILSSGARLLSSGGLFASLEDRRVAVYVGSVLRENISREKVSGEPGTGA